MAKFLGLSQFLREASSPKFFSLPIVNHLSENYHHLVYCDKKFHIEFGNSWRQFHSRFSSAFNEQSSENLSASQDEKKDVPELEESEGMEFDVLVVGGGVAGLSAAIRLKQLEPSRSVCVVEKGAEIGSHILSGNVFEPRALNELMPNWRDEGAPLRVPVNKDRFSFFTQKRSFPLPSPFQNHGNYVISLSELTRWLGTKAEEMGVEIYSGFSAEKPLFTSFEGAEVGDGETMLEGVKLKDVGISKDGKVKSSFQKGMTLKGRLTFLAEGCRGSISEQVISAFDLREKGKAQHQTYALGIKELWQVDNFLHSPGFVFHSIGFPLDRKTYGGSFMYHMDEGRIALGLVVALDFENPFLSPYEEFQRWKLHPSVRPYLEGGEVLEYGARALNEGGIQSLPEVVFPGGALIGCSAGFLNVPKIKGSHTAMKSGMLAAEAAHTALSLPGGSHSEDFDVYQAMRERYCKSEILKSWVGKELMKARNIRPGFRSGLLPGLVNATLENYVTFGHSPWTLSHRKADHLCMKPASECSPIPYPKPDGKITFDILTSVYRSATNHNHDQPPHLKLKDDFTPYKVNLPKFNGPEQRYCPARVYEYVRQDLGSILGGAQVEGDEGRKRDNKAVAPSSNRVLQINAQNCLHCKACDIKDPSQNILWAVPEGGGGPGYTQM